MTEMLRDGIADRSSAGPCSNSDMFIYLLDVCCKWLIRYCFELVGARTAPELKKHHANCIWCNLGKELVISSESQPYAFNVRKI